MTKKTAVLKAAKAVAITDLISAITVELKAERLETARLRSLINISGGQRV
jgi:hypothetical protein